MSKLTKAITKNKGLFRVASIITIIYTIINALLLFNIASVTGISGIGAIVKNSVFILLIIIWIFFIISYIHVLIKKKKKKFWITTLILIVYTLLLAYITYQSGNILKVFNKISTNSTTYSSSIISLKENTTSNIKDVKGKIGLLNDSNSYEGYKIPNEIIKDKKLNSSEKKEYDNYISLLTALYNKEIDFAFLPTNYMIMFKSYSGFEKLDETTKIIYSKEKSVKSVQTSSGKKLDKPFTILLMGVDSEVEDINGSSFNGDSLMLITFNPTTYNTTILSIPRDTYVPIACFDTQRKNKITHAAWYGEDCMMKTIENFTGIKIDYYAKINFKGVVKLVDTLGGINVDVPYSFCEQDSNRTWGSNTVYVKSGVNNLNGEQALALARNRHPNPEHCTKEWTNYTSNDFVRGQNQQLIIKGLLNKMKSINSIDKIQNLLNVLSKNMQTNMSKTEMFSLYNVAESLLLKNNSESIEEILQIKKLYMSGFDAMIYDYSSYNNQGTLLTLYNFVPYKGSINDIVTAMKINLGLEEATVIKKFNFDVDTDYQEVVVGKGYYKENTLTLLPNFVGKTSSEAVNFCNKYGITLNISKTSGSGYSNGKIVKQSLRNGMDLDAINKTKGLTITVEENSSSSNRDSNEN